jgi:hypothetical protein
LAACAAAFYIDATDGMALASFDWLSITVATLASCAARPRAEKVETPIGTLKFFDDIPAPI